MKDKKKAIIKFDQSSKLPIIFYIMSVVILSCVFMIITLVNSGLHFTIGKPLDEGDLNKDGKLSSSDALYIIEKENGKTELNGAQIDAADINKDGLINSLDAKLIVQYSSETSKKLGVLGVGITKMENPSDRIIKTEGSSNDSQNSQQIEEDFVSSGSSYATAFCTTEEEIYSTAKVVNKWSANNKYYYQIDVVIINYSDNYIGDTSVELDFTSDVTVEKSWDCSATDSDYGINITTQNNTYINDGGMLKCGIVVSSPIAVDIESVSK